MFRPHIAAPRRLTGRSPPGGTLRQARCMGAPVQFGAPDEGFLVGVGSVYLFYCELDSECQDGIIFIRKANAYKPRRRILTENMKCSIRCCNDLEPQLHRLLCRCGDVANLIGLSMGYLMPLKVSLRFIFWKFIVHLCNGRR